MHCEFCDKFIHDSADAKRHVLTASHIRHKNEYDLNRTRLVERMRQAAINPKDFGELNILLDVRSEADVDALISRNFFKISNATNSKIAREMIRILFSNSTNYYLNCLPYQLRQHFLRAYEEEGLKYRNFQG